MEIDDVSRRLYWPGRCSFRGCPRRHVLGRALCAAHAAAHAAACDRDVARSPAQDLIPWIGCAR